MSVKKQTIKEAEPVRTVLPDAASEAPAKAPKEAEPEATVYLGPSIDKVVNHGTVFRRGEISGALEEKIKEIPAIRGLIVPISDYARVAREITLPEGRYRTLFDKVKASE